MKIFYSLFLTLIGLGLTVSFSQTPSIDWWYDTNDASFGMSCADDIDGDGNLEVIFGCYRNDSSVYALNADDGTLLWKYNASPMGSHGCNDVAPITYDVNGDGTKEVIVPGSCNPKTWCFDGATGDVIWEAATRGSDSPPTIADIDDDGTPEVLHGEFGGYVICFDAENGAEEWELLVDENSWVQTAPTLVDLNDDGQLDFVVATWNFDYEDSVYAYNGADRSLMWSYPIMDHVYHGTAVADFDEDGKPELLIGSYNDTLYCINGEDGSTEWKYGGPGGYVGSPATIGDVDGDGNCDVIVTNGFKVTALENTGDVKWDYTIPGFSSAFRGVALADVNDDANLDVVFCAINGNLIGLNGMDGNELWSVDLAEHYGDPQFELNHAPLISDFNNDGDLDVFVVGGHAQFPDIEFNFGRAYMLTIGPGAGPDWLMFQHDVRRQSSMCPFPYSQVELDETIVEDDIILYPNPAQDRISFQTNDEHLVGSRLTIYAPIGQLVWSENIKNALTTISTANFDNGLYLYQVQLQNGEQKSGKFVVSR